MTLSESTGRKKTRIHSQGLATTPATCTGTDGTGSASRRAHRRRPGHDPAGGSSRMALPTFPVTLRPAKNKRHLPGSVRGAAGLENSSGSAHKVTVQSVHGCVCPHVGRALSGLGDRAPRLHDLLDTPPAFSSPGGFSLTWGDIALHPPHDARESSAWHVMGMFPERPAAPTSWSDRPPFCPEGLCCWLPAVGSWEGSLLPGRQAAMRSHVTVFKPK